MDDREKQFFAKLLETFREEAFEHVSVISDGLLELEKNSSFEQRQQLIESIFREAHSLKGAARSVNQQSILEICQTLETFFSLWKQNKLEVTTDSYTVLYSTLKTISQALDHSLEPSTISNAIEKLKNITFKSTEPSDEEKKNLPKSPSETVSSNLTTPQRQQEKTIRVSIEKVNRFFQEAEETLMIKIIFNAHLNQLKDLRTTIAKKEKELNRILLDIQVLRQKSPASMREKIKDILIELEKHRKDLINTKETLSKFVQNAEQNKHVVENSIDKLLEDLKKIIMQPMGMLFQSFPHMIRDISIQLGKEINVEFQGEDIEVDRRISEGIKDAVIHIIRNAIDHGIESPENRVKAKKPQKGTIRITAIGSEGNNVKLSISDDGQGIDIEKIKQEALKKGYISQKEFENITDSETIKLAFHSDISTSPIVTELSGRGIGLGIVSEKVENLGGKLEVFTSKNKGTNFVLTLPLTLATFRGVHISISDQDFVLPTHNIDRVVRINPKEIKKLENRETIAIGNSTFSFIHLADLLGIKKNKKLEKTFLFALIIKAAEQTIVFGADNVHSEEEILVKGVGKQNMRLKNVLAVTVLESGKVIPILNPIDLIKSSIEKPKTSSILENTDTEISQKKSILLVEDSITTRLLLSNILSSAQYEVKTAADGIEALETLKNQSFDLIVTDIEMPRMDGFTLLEKIKENLNLKDVPIVICSALGSSHDRKRGIELGANAYLDKSTFNLQTFLSIVQKLI